MFGSKERRALLKTSHRRLHANILLDMHNCVKQQICMNTYNFNKVMAQTQAQFDSVVAFVYVQNIFFVFINS